MLRFETLTNEPSIIHLLPLILIRVGGGWSLSQCHRAYGPGIGNSHRTRVGVQPGLKKKKKMYLNSIFQLFCVNNSLNSL